jgi:hypothetical protein
MLEQVDPTMFQTDDRYDIGVEVAYARLPCPTTRKQYVDLIRVFNGGLGSDRIWKVSVDDFVDAFHRLFGSMKKHGFIQEHAIPVDEEYNPLDGSHRIACAIALGLPSIWVNRQIGVHSTQKFTEEYFKRRGFPNRRFRMWRTYWRLRLMRKLCPLWVEKLVCGLVYRSKKRRHDEGTNANRDNEGSKHSGASGGGVHSASS